MPIRLLFDALHGAETAPFRRGGRPDGHSTSAPASAGRRVGDYAFCAPTEIRLRHHCGTIRDQEQHPALFRLPGLIDAPGKPGVVDWMRTSCATAAFTPLLALRIEWGFSPPEADSFEVKAGYPSARADRVARGIRRRRNPASNASKGAPLAGTDLRSVPTGKGDASPYNGDACAPPSSHDSRSVKAATIRATRTMKSRSSVSGRSWG